MTGIEERINDLMDAVIRHKYTTPIGLVLSSDMFKELSTITRSFGIFKKVLTDMDTYNGMIISIQHQATNFIHVY